MRRQRLLRQRGRERIRLLRIKRFDCMSDAVHAGRDSHALRQRRREERIVNHELRPTTSIATDTLLVADLATEERRHLRARVRRRQRHESRAVLDGEDLAEPERRAAADRHDAVATCREVELAATLDVGNRALATNDLTFVSRDVDMTGAGTVSLTTQAVDFRTIVILSPELSAQAGRDLIRVAREGDRVVLPARITGTITAPSAFVDVQAALQRAIRNRAQDELKSLFDRLGKGKR